jgi:uncharacterized protein (PEP-CTERM system associated)
MARIDRYGAGWGWHLTIAGMFCLAGPMLSATASAADWRFTPSLSFQEVVTDNVDQSDTDKRGDALSQLIPALNVTADSPRGQLSLLYAPIFSAYVAEPGQDRVDQNLVGNGSVDFFDNHFNVDFNVFANQGSGSGSFGEVGASGLVPLSDRTLNYGGTIAPHLRERFGDVATLDAFYRVSSSNTSGSDSLQPQLDNLANNLLQQDAEVILGSGNSFNDLSAQLDLDHVDGSGSGPNNRFQNDLDVTKFEYHLTHAYALTGFVGYQRIHYDASPGYAGYDDAGPTWSAGVKATPNDFTTFELSYGRQSGSYNVEAHVRYDLTPRTHIAADYAVSVENQLQANLGSFQAPVGIGSPIGAPPTPIGGSALGGNVSQLFGDQNGLFRDKIASVSFVRQFTRSTVTVTAGNDHRVPLSGPTENDDAWYGGAHYSREMTPSLTGDVGIDYSTHTYGGSALSQQQRDRLLNVSVTATYSINPTLSATASYSLFRRDSNLNGFSTTANELMIGIRKEF